MIQALNPYKSVKHILMRLSYRQENWGSERLSSFSKVEELVIWKVDIWTHMCLFQTLGFIVSAKFHFWKKS